VIYVLCEECEKQSICTKLCKEAEAWASQDKVSWSNEWILKKDEIENFSTEDEIEWSTDKSPELIDFSATKYHILSPRQKQVADLYFNYNLSQYEIANKLNISRSAVQFYMRKCILKLRKTYPKDI